MGLVNRLGRSLKNLKYKVQNDKKYIVAEGDSWFEHFFLKEIIDHLIEKLDNPIYTLAYGGDWIGNYIEDQKYLKELLRIQPDFFLLSGGGNDLVGGGRIKDLVHDRKEVDLSLTNFDKTELAVLESTYSPQLSKKVVLGRKFLNKRFHSLLNIFQFQYLLIIRSIENEETLKGIKIITQGYDFAIPSNKKNTIFRLLLGHGSWLHKPMVKKDITDPFEQEAVIAAMLFAFNEMLIYISSLKKNVYHIDCRECANRDDWKDELHLKSKVYNRIALTYKNCIESTNPQQKIHKVEYIRP